MLKLKSKWGGDVKNTKGPYVRDFDVRSNLEMYKTNLLNEFFLPSCEDNWVAENMSFFQPCGLITAT